MARLFVANCTRINKRVHYRLDFSADPARRTAPKSQDIPAGRQVCLGGDLNIDQIQTIIGQLNRFGMVGTVDLGRLPRRQCPYLFNIDKEVSAAQIKAVVAHNNGVLTNEGADRRRRLAIAANNASIGGNEFNYSIEQQDNEEQTGGRLEEGYRIDTTAPRPPAAPRKRGSRRAA